MPSGKRLDALTSTKHRATEVERSSKKQNLLLVVERLKQSKAPQKVLQVPNNNLNSAVELMRESGVSGTVKYLGETKSHRVRKKKLLLGIIVTMKNQGKYVNVQCD